jgi:hypothetical protein
MTVLLTVSTLLDRPRRRPVPLVVSDVEPAVPLV